MPARLVYYKLTLLAFGSGELKSDNFSMFHYENIPMQYIVILTDENLCFFSQWGDSNEHTQSMF